MAAFEPRVRIHALACAWILHARPVDAVSDPEPGARNQNFPLTDKNVSLSVVSRSRVTSIRTMLQSTS